MRYALKRQILTSFVLAGLVPLICGLGAMAACGETIRLKNGSSIEGEIDSKDENHTNVRVPFGTITLSNQDVAEILPSATQSPALVSSVVSPKAVTPAWGTGTPVPISKPVAKPRGPILFEPSDKITLEEIEKRTILYFWEQSNPNNGMIQDRSRPGSPASIAACGFGLAALCIAEHRGWIDEEAVQKRVQVMLEFLKDRAQQEHGFFYHFLNMNSGKREWDSEISSIDNALLMAGVLFVAQHYPNSVIATHAKIIFNRVEWPWMLNGGSTFCLDWRPEKGFSSGRWDTYAEHMILTIEAMGSPSHPVLKKCWKAWSRKPKTYGRYKYIHNPQESLFVYLTSHAWIDFRGRHDGAINWWKNSAEAIKANRKFCQDNKKIFKTYENNIWGLSETDGPDGYRHYGAVPSGHDGTIAPYALISSLPFLPDLSREGIATLTKKYASKIWGRYGFTSGLNRDRKWYSKEYIGIQEGLTALMLENYRSGFVWKTMKGSPIIRAGMRKAGL